MKTPTGAPRQIPLGFGSYQQIDFDSFISDQNQHVVELLKKIASDQARHHVYLWGKAASGKSHILQAACKLASDKQLQVAYVPLEHIEEFSPEMLHDLGMLDMVCIDSIDCLAGKQTWQQALVWLYNELRDNGNSLLMAGGLAPRALTLEVEDLRSRLGWDLVYQVKSPDDAIKKKILQENARNRGFELPDEVVDFLIHRVDRELSNLIALLDKIDEVSLAEQRKITIPFLKKYLVNSQGKL